MKMAGEWLLSTLAGAVLGLLAALLFISLFRKVIYGFLDKCWGVLSWLTRGKLP